MTASLGIFGKHPGFGDFLAHGLSEPSRNGLDSWLGACLPPLRDRLGDGWEAFWDMAPVLRFWIGRALAGRTMAGVLRTSQDRVGRRFPLLLLAEGASLPAPIQDPDQTFYRALEDQFSRMIVGEGARSLLEGFDPADLPGSESEDSRSEGPTVWAQRSDGNLSVLLTEAAPVDHARAATARSYWWSESGRSGQALWLAQPGMPGADAMGWLLGGGDA
ncbi:MAG: type VI secretion system-associated protein TagF [Tabrizicola sp.]|jgi:type VI secretion system protein ImpM|nr:type VI secretion system-associated protein TagF [Tabrizicola sp.]